MKSSYRLSSSNSSSSWCFSNKASKIHWDSQDHNHCQRIKRCRWLRLKERLGWICKQLNLQVKGKTLRVCNQHRDRPSRYSMSSNNKRCWNNRSCKWILATDRIPPPAWETEASRARAAEPSTGQSQGSLPTQERPMECSDLPRDPGTEAKRGTKRPEVQWLSRV